MAKELPYFRFTVSEWLNDDISMEDYKTKGVFADVCAFYWFRDCSVDIALLEKRFSDALTTILSLVELNIIKYNNNGQVSINFLDVQFDLLSEKRKKYAASGRKGGLSKSSNAKATLKQRSSYKDKDNNKEKEKDNNKDIKANKFATPQFEEIKDYFFEKLQSSEQSNFEAEKFIDFYSSKGWMVGRNKMKDWEASVRNWIKGIKKEENDKGTNFSEQNTRDRVERWGKAFEHLK